MDKKGSIYLCKPGGVPLGLLNVEEDTVKLKKSLTNIWELSFEINEMLNGEKNPWYDQITERMELLLVDNILNEKYRFIINTQPTKAISASDVKSILTVSANGIECDLQVKYLKRFKVNCGTTDSQEYLVYEENEDGSVNTKRNLNAYSVNPGMTNSRLAIDYIQLDCRLDKVCESYIQKLDGISEEDMEYSPIAGTYIIKNDSKYCNILKNLVADVPRIQKHLSYDKDDVEILTCYVYTSSDNISIDSIEKLKEGLDLLYKYYSKYKNKLSLFKLALENAQEGTWGVGEISDEFAATKWNFEVDDGDIYSFLTNTFANYARAIISFDRYNKTISAKRIEEYNTSEYDTGVRIDMKNLVNEVNIDSNLQEGIKTKLYVGNDTLGIENAHFTDYIMNMDYYMNAQTDNGEYQYVDDNIHDAYFKWKDYCYNTPYKTEISVENEELRNSTYEHLKSLYGDDSVEISGNSITISYPSRQNAYKELSKLYNQSIIDSDEIQYLLPTDYATVDFTTYQYDELVMSWLAYANAISSLETMYKSDYGYNQIYWRTLLPEEYPYDMDDISKLKDNMEDGCVPIEDTIYFGDWYAYKYSIMPQVYESLKRWVNTEDVVDPDDNILYSYLLDKNDERVILSKFSLWGKNFDTDDFNKADPANLKFLKCEDDYLKTINDWVYQWELYGRDEIQSKFNAWNEASKLIYNDSFVKTSELHKKEISRELLNPINPTTLTYITEFDDLEYPLKSKENDKDVLYHDISNESYYKFDGYHLNYIESYEVSPNEPINIYAKCIEENDNGNKFEYYYDGAYTKLCTLIDGTMYRVNYEDEGVIGGNTPFRLYKNGEFGDANNGYIEYYLDHCVVYDFNSSLTHRIYYDETGSVATLKSGSIYKIDNELYSYFNGNLSKYNYKEEYKIKYEYYYTDEKYLDSILLHFYYDDNGVIQWDEEVVDDRDYFTTVEVKQHKPYTTSYTDLNEEEKENFSETIKEAGFTSSGWHDVFRKWTDYWGYTSRDSDTRNQMTNRYEGFAGLGVCIQTQVMLAIRNKEMDDINTIGDMYNSLRKNIQEECSYATYKGFNSKHREVINQLISTTSYTNDNITGTYTSLDNIATQVDIQQNLYEDAVNKLSELSQPQYSFSVTMENLFALELFSPMWEQFEVGNFIYLDTNLYDSMFKKLRVISIENNPIIHTSELTIEFSSMTKSLNGFSDLAFILENIAQGSTGSSGGTSSSGGTYGENEADIQFSNNVLNALLMNNSVKTAAANAIIDTIQSDDGSFKKLFASSGAFDSLNVGETAISGDCVTTGSIKSTNYSVTTDDNGHTIQKGSILNLDDGTFKYADGNLTYENNTLTITGDINATNMSLQNGLVVGDINDVTKPSIQITPDGRLICRGSDINTKSLALEESMRVGSLESGKLFALDSNGYLTVRGADITCSKFSSPTTNNLQNATDVLTTRVDALEAKLNTKVTNLEEEIESLKKSIDALQKKVSNHESRIKALE